MLVAMTSPPSEYTRRPTLDDLRLKEAEARVRILDEAAVTCAVCRGPWRLYRHPRAGLVCRDCFWLSNHGDFLDVPS